MKCKNCNHSISNHAYSKSFRAWFCDCYFFNEEADSDACPCVVFTIHGLAKKIGFPHAHTKSKIKVISFPIKGIPIFIDKAKGEEYRPSKEHANTGH